VSWALRRVRDVAHARNVTVSTLSLSDASASSSVTPTSSGTASRPKRRSTSGVTRCASWRRAACPGRLRCGAHRGGDVRVRPRHAHDAGPRRAHPGSPGREWRLRLPRWLDWRSRASVVLPAWTSQRISTPRRSSAE